MTRLSFRTSGLPRLDRTGRYLAVDTARGETTLLDLARGTRWRVPQLDPVDTISATGRTAMLFGSGRVSIVHFDAPEEPGVLRDRVVHATNYTLDAIGP